MAFYTWSDISNGETGLSVRTKLNTALAALESHVHTAATTTYDNSTSGLTATNVKTAIDEVSANTDSAATGAGTSYTNTTSGLTATDVQAAIDEVEGRLDTAETSVSNLNNIGVCHMTCDGVTPSVQAITTTPTILDWADVVHHSYGTQITGDPTTDKFTINESGVFNVFGTIVFEAPNGSYTSMRLYKNGSPITPNIEVVGQGAGKNSYVSYTTMETFAATDYLEIYVTGDSSYDITINCASVIIEKTPYPIV